MKKIEEMKNSILEPTFDEALAVCIKYYVDKGYTIEHSSQYVGRREKEVFELYHIIQEEKKMPQDLSTVVDLKELTGGD